MKALFQMCRFERENFPISRSRVEAWSGDQRVGFGGQLLADKSSASNSVLVAELNADLLLDNARSVKKFRELDRYPSITRDIAMIVPEKLTPR